MCQVVFTYERERFVFTKSSDKIIPLYMASQRLGWAGLGWKGGPSPPSQGPLLICISAVSSSPILVLHHQSIVEHSEK